jgi:hypothetical protein
VTWDGIEERHQRALDEFYEAHPRAHEAVVVTADSWETALSRLYDHRAAEAT